MGGGGESDVMRWMMAKQRRDGGGVRPPLKRARTELMSERRRSSVGGGRVDEDYDDVLLRRAGGGQATMTMKPKHVETNKKMTVMRRRLVNDDNELMMMNSNDALDDDYNDDEEDEDDDVDDTLIKYGHTPKNSFSGVFAAAGQPEQRRRSQEEENVAGKRGHYPQLAAQLQSEVRDVRAAEQVPRLKIRTNGIAGVAAGVAKKSFSTEAVVQQQQTAETGVAGEAGDLYCYCRRPYVGEMIGCDGDGCRIEWFHFECVGIMMAPQGKWFCPDCVQKKQNRTNGTRTSTTGLKRMVGGFKFE